MTKKINYEDDIFSLNLFVRNLSDILKLDIDPDLFRERVQGDIAFLDLAINRLFESLEGGPLFLKRDEHLKEMQRLKRSFVALLDSLIDGQAPISQFLLPFHGHFKGMREAHDRDVSNIRSLLSRTASRDEEHIVSEDEFKILLSPPEEEN
jgi:hypothetical protein